MTRTKCRVFSSFDKLGDRDVKTALVHFIKMGDEDEKSALVHIDKLGYEQAKTLWYSQEAHIGQNHHGVGGTDLY